MNIKDLLTEKRLYNLEEMVAELSLEELKLKIDEGEIFHLVEVSNEEDYNKGHIPGAVNMPLNTLRETADQKFRKYEQIVVYCQETSSSVGSTAARILQRMGFSNVLLFQGGKEAWQNAGFPLDEQTEKHLKE
ncbi:MAG: rhodanese-like domain-containing protein [bacterium]